VGKVEEEKSRNEERLGGKEEMFLKRHRYVRRQHSTAQREKPQRKFYTKLPRGPQHNVPQIELKTIAE
jgi:hypothetical protein